MVLKPIIERTWDCLPPPERAAYRDMGVAFQSGHPFEFADLIRLHFQTYSPAWWETRFNAWLANSTYRVSTIMIDEIEVDVILTNKVVAIQTAACLNEGGCPPDPVPCLQVTGF